MKGLEGVSVVGVQQIDRVVEVVEEAARGNTVKLLGQKTLPRLDLPKIRKNALVRTRAATRSFATDTQAVRRCAAAHGRRRWKSSR